VFAQIELTWNIIVGGIITRGPGLAFTEALAVLPNGRSSPQDAGLWSDEQIGPLKQIVDFAHSQNQKIAIQLTHAGRKASTVARWLHTGMSAPEVDGGWPNDVWGPSAVAYNEFFPSPTEATVPQIKALVQAFVDAARRALTAGVDVLEIHGGHGYMISEFLSPTTNRRTDDYGGSFENRVRLALEVVDAIRAVVPESMPLLFRYVISFGGILR
jgi:2,4-dienoyl-CoA reductase-like NADH-dependent reductase (Old Yellow Enzyme family)